MLVIAALGLSLTSYGQQQAQPLAPTLDQHRPATAAPTQPAPQATPAPAQGVTPSPNPSYNPTYNPVFKPGYQRPITNQYGRPLGQGQPIRQWVQGESVPNAQNIIIILDASESMNDEINGVPKMTLAKQAIMQTLGNLPPNVRVGLRVYGHQVVSRGLFSSGGKNCQQTELIIPLGFNNRQEINQRVQSIQAVGMTPISLALMRSVSQDFYNSPGENMIILVSDGRETCDANPCDVALSLARSNVKVRVNSVGFGIKDPVAQDQLRCVAAATKGRFYDAQTAAQLADGLNKSMTSVNAKIVGH
ncbi:MAG: VWA domain-containing protein [Cyanobacteria bacterium HKST-UBA06]|nr:VWA domain-containing protein [Cyanobacteria bacterium HKST-UBA06]